MFNLSSLSRHVLSILPVLVGILSHHLYFIHNEHQKRALLYLGLAAAFPVVSSVVIAFLSQESILQSTCLALRWESEFLIAAFGSIAIYRLSPKHRLASFSGPLSWRLSKLAHCLSNRTFQGYRTLHGLHQKYGEFVRTGPSELSIIDPEAVSAILGPRSRCARAPWYGMADPLKAIFHTRNRTEHDSRRRLWEQGLSKSALQEYGARIEQQIALLSRRITEKVQSRDVTNVSVLFNHLTFDVMGQIGFGKSFDMLETCSKLGVLKILEDGQKGLGMFGCVPWLFMCLTRLPWISRDHDVFVRWCEDVMMERVSRRTKGIDIASGLVDAAAASPNPVEAHQWLTGDSRILIVAGSDAVASSLTFAFYYLAQDSSRTAILRRELETIEKLSASALQNHAPHLNAFITEVLRLWPPNPSGVLRQTPKEGVHVGDTYVPGDVTVCVPFWAMHRSSKCFVQPDSFIPERWTTRSDMVLRKEAYIPFGYGAYSCIGKQLALMEIRLVISHLVMQFDICFGAAENGRALLNDSKDWFTWGLADLNIEFVPWQKTEKDDAG